MLSIEEALKMASANDWSFLDKLEENFGASPQSRKAREKAELDRKMLAEATARVFSGRDGEIVLDWLLDQTWRRLTFAVMTRPDPQQAVLYGAFREGQNALALTIIRMIAAGRSEEPPPNQE